MEDKNSPPGASNSSDTAESPPAQSPSPPKANKSPPPASPPPPPPSSPPPVRSPPPSPPPPPPTSQSPPPPSSSPPPSSQSTPQSPPPPPNAQSLPTPSSNSPPPLSPPQFFPNSSPPPSQNNPSDPPPDDSINTSPPPALDNNNGKGNGNNNNNKQWNPPPPPPASSSNSSQNSNGSPALSPPSESSNGSPSNNNGSSSMLSIPVVAAVAAGVALLIIVMLLLFFACRKKTNRERNDKMPYYYNNHSTANNYYNNAATRPPQPLTNWQTDGGVSGGGGAPLYNNTAHGHNQNYNNMHANDDQLNALPPLPGGVPKVDWPTPPPPHRGAVPAVTNSDMSPASNSSPYGPVVPPPAAIPALGLSQSEFTYEELSAATGGFSQSSVLGKGGFGYVHKGTLPNGKEIAVKSLKPGSGQGEREFKAEVKIISRIHHRHLVSLVGYCIAVDKRLLVYEYVTNNNLEYHLHGKGQPVMDWSTRLKIALGSAKGLAYLHEDCHPRIIHRDIKSSNILLDFTWEAKVGDFGLAKLNADNNTHVSTRVMGTFGYLAPEYASSGKLTEKSDVFSFGVMLLELITGRRPVDPTRAMEDTLVDWARPLCLRALEDGNFDELADPYLEKNYQVEEMARMVACAGASIRHSARRRPKVSQIVRALEGDMSLEDFNNGIKPSQASIFNGETTSSSKSYDLENSSYTEDLMKLRKMAGENTGGRYVSSEYGATSEYGLNPSSSSSEFESRDQSPRNNIKSSF